MVAKGHLRLVEDHHVGVGKEVFAHLDVEAVVAKEWLYHLQLLACLAQDALDERGLLVVMRGAQVVVVAAHLLCLLQDVEQLGVVAGVVGLAAHHLLQLLSLFFGELSHR